MRTVFSKDLKQLKFCFLILFVNVSLATAQQSVSIGDTQVKANAVLYLKGTGSQGLIIPAVTTNGTFGEQGMLVFNTTDKKLYYHNGISWVDATGLTEVDAVIGNEISQINATRGGLELTGSGTNASPLSLGIMPGTVDGQILKWDNTAKKWVLGTDAGVTYTAGTGISITGSSIANTGDTNGADDITTASTATGDLSGTFPNLSVNRIRGINVVATAPTTNQVLQYNGTNWTPASLTFGSVSSVGLTLPSLFTVSGSPITTSGTFNATLSSQPTATVFAAPTAAAGAPTFRTLAPTDIPALDAAKITTGTFPLARINAAPAGVRAILACDNNNVGWVNGAPNQLLATDAAGVLAFTNKSNFTFTTDNVIPKGTPGGLIASQIFDDGTNVGIGSTTPTNKLEVWGVGPAVESNGAGTFYANASNYYNAILAYGNDTGTSAAGTNYSRGALAGIHTSSPVGSVNFGAWGHVYGNGVGGYGVLASYGPNPGTAPVYAALAGSTNAGIFMGGNVGIGTTSPTQALDVVGDVQISGYYHFTGGVYMFHVSGNYSGINDHWIPNNNNAYDLGTVTYRWRNAYLNNNPNVSSDSRLKKDIVGLNYGLTEVMKLRPVSYKMKSDEEQKTKLGFIAQEVKQIIPEIVTEDNSPEKYLGMSYSELIPVLINAIQEQQKTIEMLKSEIGSLQNKNEAETNQLRAEVDEIKKMLNLEAKKK